MEPKILLLLQASLLNTGYPAKQPYLLPQSAPPKNSKPTFRRTRLNKIIVSRLDYIISNRPDNWNLSVAPSFYGSDHSPISLHPKEISSTPHLNQLRHTFSYHKFNMNKQAIEAQIKKELTTKILPSHNPDTILQKFSRIIDEVNSDFALLKHPNDPPPRFWRKNNNKPLKKLRKQIKKLENRLSNELNSPLIFDTLKQIQHKETEIELLHRHGTKNKHPSLPFLQQNDPDLPRKINKLLRRMGVRKHRTSPAMITQSSGNQLITNSTHIRSNVKTFYQNLFRKNNSQSKLFQANQDTIILTERKNLIR